MPISFMGGDLFPDQKGYFFPKNFKVVIQGIIPPFLTI